MLVGVDFDNTIVCYDQVFHKAGVELGLIPPHVPANKGNVRDYLRSIGKENEWIELQGYVYGPRMEDALPFSGVLEFFNYCRQQGTPVQVISHRTRYPFRGPSYDLHQAARDWLKSHGISDSSETGLSRSDVYFELTKEEKLGRIRGAGCTHFIDDLPEFLSEPDFPVGVQRILFDPEGKSPAKGSFQRATSWDQIGRMLEKDLI